MDAGHSQPRPPEESRRRFDAELRSRSIVLTRGGRAAAYRARRVILRANADQAERLVRRLGTEAVMGAEASRRGVGDAAAANAERARTLNRPVRRGGCTVLDLPGSHAPAETTRSAVEVLRSGELPVHYNTVYFGQALPTVSPLYAGMPGFTGDPNRSTAVPAPPPAPWPGGGAAPGAPAVAILDSGLATSYRHGVRVPAHTRLRNHVRVHQSAWDMEDVLADTADGPVVLKAADEDLRDENGDGILDRQAGHGTFIAGIVRRLAPQAEIHVDGCLTSFGDGDDESITRSLDQLAERLSHHTPLDRLVINLSFGGYTDDDQPPPLLSAAIVELAGQGAAFVAAAGNDDTARPLWPAALPEVIAVAALDPAAGKAWFSNYGGWVDACAPGIDVVSTFFRADFDTDPPPGAPDPDRYRGYALWSGTSFAAPQVSAAVAAEVARTGAAAAAAARSLVEDPRRHRLPDLGTVVNG